MKYHYITNENRPSLTLFFAGWGMDQHPFEQYQSKDSDMIIVYDYRSLELDESILKKYDKIYLVAWSMGVWAATQCQFLASLPIKRNVAINGTPWPVDDVYGIPEAIFKGTLAGLREATLRKFQLRMCGKGDVFRQFQAVTPQRSVEELKEELAAIGEVCKVSPVSNFRWDEAYIGENDLIFPANNQKAAWEKAGVETKTGDAAHYDVAVFKHYLNSI